MTPEVVLGSIVAVSCGIESIPEVELGQVRLVKLHFLPLKKALVWAIEDSRCSVNRSGAKG